MLSAHGHWEKLFLPVTEVPLPPLPKGQENQEAKANNCLWSQYMITFVTTWNKYKHLIKCQPNSILAQFIVQTDDSKLTLPRSAGEETGFAASIRAGTMGVAFSLFSSLVACDWSVGVERPLNFEVRLDKDDTPPMAQPAHDCGSLEPAVVDDKSFSTKKTHQLSCAFTPAVIVPLSLFVYRFGNQDTVPTPEQNSTD